MPTTVAVVPTPVAAVFDSFAARAAQARAEADEALAQQATFVSLMVAEHTALAARYTTLRTLREDDRRELVELRGRLAAVTGLLDDLTATGPDPGVARVINLVRAELDGQPAEDVVVALLRDGLPEHEVRAAIDELVTAGRTYPALDGAVVLGLADVERMRARLRAAAG